MSFVLPTNEMLDEQMLLGYLTFTAIDDIKVHKADLAKLFQKHGLSLSHHDIKAHDAFRRATSRANRSIVIKYEGREERARLMVYEIKCDAERIVRHLVRVRVNRDIEETEHATVGKFIFHRNTELMSVSWNPDYLDEYDYAELVKSIQKLYEEWTEYHTKDTIRNLVSRIIRSMQPVNISQTGAGKFIPKHHKATLFGLQKVLNELPGETSMEILPLLDTVELRRLLQRNLSQEIIAEAESMIAELSEALQERNVRKSTIQKYFEAFHELQEKISAYEQLLQVRMDTLHEQLAELLHQIPIEEEVAVGR